MGLTNIEDLKAGMVLAGDVADSSGRILMSSGFELTELHIKLFRKYGVLQASVESESHEHEIVSEPSEGAEIDGGHSDEVTLKVDRLFRHADTDHAAVKELYKACAERMAKRLSGGVAHAS